MPTDPVAPVPVQDLSAKKSDFVSGLVSEDTALLDVFDSLVGRRSQYDALGMAPGSGTPYELKDEDFVGANAHLTAQDVADAFSSLDALKAVLLQGHLTNLNRVRR